ncbi:MAG: hypothetical protein QXF52_10050, partial [Thermoproteota archaeon]
NIGYRISCSTLSGSISIFNIPDTVVISEENHGQEVATSNYSGKDIRTAVTVSTISGNIRVTGK